MKTSETAIAYVGEPWKDLSYPQHIPETEVQEASQQVEPHVIPFTKGLRLMSEREADECARHGEVLTWRLNCEHDPKRLKMVRKR